MRFQMHTDQWFYFRCEGGDKKLKIKKSYELPFPVERVYATWVSSGTVVAPATAMDIDPVAGSHYLPMRICQSLPEPIPYFLAKLP
jgi:hypothetical protein